MSECDQQNKISENKTQTHANIVRKNAAAIASRLSEKGNEVQKQEIQ